MADPTQLPLAQSGANSVLPDMAKVGTLQQGIVAGGTYTDPYTTTLILRLTDKITPQDGNHDHGYSEGGPRISQSWLKDGQEFSTVILGNGYLADIRHHDLSVHNWRALTVEMRGEIGVAWSLDPATPRILHVVTDWDTNQVDRYDTDAMAVANVGHWPWRVAAEGEYFGWFQGSVNDQWFVGMLNSNATLVAFRPSDGVERSLSTATLGFEADEPHLDRTLPYVYVVPGRGSDPKVVWRLEDGTRFQGTDLAPDPIMSWSHSAPLCGAIVGTAYWQQRDTHAGAFYYRPDVDQTVHFIPTLSGFHGASNDWYNAGQWCLSRRGPAVTDQWFVADRFLDDDPGAKIRRGMVAFVRLDGEVRLLAAHGSTATDYDCYPQTTLAPDGRLVMWTSNMNGSGRHDVYIARVPVK